ncbi:MAG: hypothetical protein II413_06665, partial [Treponema sp.]|nr:hypothetical protein [Treponema sp.]
QSVKEYGVAHRFQKSEKEADTVFVQDSLYYECDVERVKGKLKILKQNLDDYEDLAGFELRIVSIKEAIEANLNYRDSDDFNIVMIA